MTKKKTNSTKAVEWQVLFGFNKEDPEMTGYFGKNLEIVSNSDSAKFFPTVNIDNAKGFGTPDQWLKFINEDDSLNHGYKFHLVKMTKKAAV